MATKQGDDFISIMGDLKAGRFYPVYILMGDESYYIDQISNYLSEHVLKPEEIDFNRSIVFGNDTSASKVTDIARQYPVMAERQLVIVKEAQGIQKLEPLEKYLANPTPTTILVWCVKNGKIDGRKYKKLLTLAKAKGVVFESKKLYESQLPAFVRNNAQSKGASIDAKACQMMAEKIGSDLNRMTSEIDKILISLKNDDKTITDAIVEREIGVSKDFNTFELKDAIIKKDVLKANRIIKYFNSNPQAGNVYGLLPLLFSFFQNMMVIYYTPGEKSDRNIAQALGLKGTWGAKDYLVGLHNYSALKTMQIISKIRETDTKMKGIENKSTSTGELMQELVFYILH